MSWRNKKKIIPKAKIAKSATGICHLCEALMFWKVRNQLICTRKKKNPGVLFKWRWLIKMVLKWGQMKENVHIGQISKEEYK